MDNYGIDVVYTMPDISSWPTWYILLVILGKFIFGGSFIVFSCYFAIKHVREVEISKALILLFFAVYAVGFFLIDGIRYMLIGSSFSILFLLLGIFVYFGLVVHYRHKDDKPITEDAKTNKKKGISIRKYFKPVVAFVSICVIGIIIWQGIEMSKSNDEILAGNNDSDNSALVQGTQVVYVRPGTNIYHVSSCWEVDVSICESMLIKEAKDEGYEPCSECIGN